MKVYIIWLLGVIAWNYLVPNAAPIEDVIVAVLLSFLSIGLIRPILKKDKSTATITSSMGAALGTK